MSTTTSTRRGVLGCGLGSAATIVLPVAASASPDAALVHACNDMLALDNKMKQLFATRQTLEDEERTEDELRGLYKREAVIKDRLYDLGTPCTMAGVQALAQVAVCRWRQYDQEGTLLAEDFDEWCAACVLEFVVDLKA